MLPLTAIPTAMPTGFTPGVDVTPMAPLPAADGAQAVPPSSDSFGSMLGQMIQDVNTKQVNANEALSSLQSGGNVSLHQAVIAMEEANVSFQLMAEVRNKLLDAYQEIMRMSV